ncbi:4-(cytidine 5'-diphospho)-2-C-methyl-D-erythritol kinase [Dissulfurirhabdus thermomarina]|uniref:4-diphosphocytidyl-2-C-methyl-D-erythritol kinase n=1 Tax=Dissulfurirhabdus thermomarina TaxID=1765737 RepID=A0A6N9TRK0_DISTH|nr:4-(cytidine 5'-diphospho)-2-C-methyl-D-erythritol kinase [Dissulfurirhabdus thermomarina]NDY42067.1 4-(cytidine 5'-diphospho)-2-C-methyl-D-erythritol kinase [Dissulfurirhabdus thermomarina]NMX24541.1 4-(cytidine 5'-diphospho)-2-C-methyl-D-erythritol kinase [Dissulfurirhabdus thermomarina]
MTRGASLSLEAPAKINLLLHVEGRRADGYHLIATVFQRVSLRDRLHLEVTPGRGGVRLSCPGSALPEDARNLAHRAAEAFLRRTGLGLDVRVELFKEIPPGGGLGGGSSDAAAVLRGLNALAGEPVPAAELMAMGAALGADVPFFLLDVPAAVGRGVGTELEPVEPPAFWYVLAMPPFGISTRWVYENFVLTTRGPDTIFDPGQALRTMAWKNDLEQVVLSAHPQVGRLKDILLAEGARAALMSGSGSTVFGAFREEARARAAAGRLAGEAGVRVRVVRGC